MERAIVRYLLDEVGFHRMQAKCCVENSASERVVQTLGMTRESVWRAYYLRKEGGYSDIVMYSLLREDART